jgi:signal transduction histidine kinase
VTEHFDLNSDIASLLNPRFVRVARSVPNASAILVILIGFLAIIGWVLGVTAFKSVMPTWETMSPNVATALIFAGISILFQYPSDRSQTLKVVGKMVGAFIALLGFITIIEYLLSWNLHIDRILFPQSIELNNMHFHGRMAPLTALNLILVGIALVFLDAKKSMHHPLSHLIAFVVTCLSLLPLIGYFYGTPFHFGLGLYSDMAMHTAVALLLISFALFFCGIDHDLATVILSDGPGGFMARRLVLPSILILIFLGWIRVLAEKHDLLSSSFGTAAFTTVAITLIVSLIWKQSATLQKIELTRQGLNNERNRLQLESELRDQFISMLSHDLRTPLTAASARAQMILKKAKTIEECKTSSQSLISSLNRLDRMILDLLDASRIRAGQPILLELRDCDISEIISLSLNDLNLIHGNRFISKAEPGAFAYCDGSAIRRIIENLCNNAVKYGASEKNVTISVKATHDMIRLAVHNEGEPISAENQMKLFEPFERAQKHLGTGGWGLGLTLVRGIAEAHHGKVWLESAEQIGTTFFVEGIEWLLN